MASFPFIRLLCFLLYTLSHALAQFYVAAPNTIRLGVQETVAVAHDVNGTLRVNLFLQDYPGKKRQFSPLTFDVIPDESEIVRIRVTPEDIPDAVFTDPNIRNYVALVVQTEGFNKEVVIPVTSKSGYVFVQTDKPVYTPKQNVKMRIIRLTEKMLPSEDGVKLQIRNPQKIIVKEDILNMGRAADRKAFVSHVYNISPNSMLGEWTISALYGAQFEHNSSVTFEVKEYVLPTFFLRLNSPDFILPDSEEITGTVTAEFVYKKKVEGYAAFKFGVKDETGNVAYFGRISSIKLKDGVANFRFSTDEIKRYSVTGWFPQISGNNFVVKATVTDFASGNQEVAVSQNGKFSESPFDISFKRCLKDFKPGLVSVIEADINYVNGQPAPGVEVTISADADGTPLNIHLPNRISDEEGRVIFFIHPEFQHSRITVTLRTNDSRYGVNQARASHIQQKFISNSNGYLAVARRSGETLRPLSSFSEDLFFEPPEISDIYYMVVSKGIILLMNKLPKGNFKSQRVEFQITYEMVPNFRLVVFAHHRNELIADSLNVDVSNQCAPNAEVTLEPMFPSTEPGSNGKIVIRGFNNTRVGLLAVDEAVYALKNKDLLTKSKMFKTMTSHDLGCGPGGGRNTNIVMGNAGVVLMTSVFTPLPGLLAVPACEQIIRRKREIESLISQNYTGREKECCEVALKKHHSDLNCYDRANVVERHEPGSAAGNCSAAFLECCLVNQNRVQDISYLRSISQGRAADDFQDELESVDTADETALEKGVSVRSDFRETWIFDDRIIGPENREEMNVSLPHRITTWVIQAVSVSNQYGMCVAEPKNVVAFQNVFLQLNLPYSVVRNEQIEIQAVVFNYGGRRSRVTVCMYGVKGICSGTQEGEKSEQKIVYVEPQSARSVSFPIIPLETGEYNITVEASSSTGGRDVIVKKLNVVAEGYTDERDIVIKLDPTNQQKRKKRQVETPSYLDFIDESRNLQVTAVKLNIPEDIIPGTDSCVISAVGDQFGPTVETSLHDPDELILLPLGSGEQNMMFLAPTMYTMRYLNVTGKMSREDEEKGYDLIRKGYDRELNYRRSDGSFADFGESRPASVWLTAFVMKIFCQASDLVNIDPEVMRSGLKWLRDNQEFDGSFIDHHPVLARDMTGGVSGKPALSAYVLIALQECTSDAQTLEQSKAKTVLYLESHLAELTEPLQIAIAAYALELSDSPMKDVAFGKLQAIEIYDEDMNTLHWERGKGAQDVEVTSYGLLAYLRRNDTIKSNSIVNWLNTKRLVSGSFSSTQDTVMALQALSEYAMAARAPAITLMSNITSSKDRHLQKSFSFREDNALVLQHLKVDKIGGLLFVNTEGHGVGLLTVKLKYNIPTPPEKLHQFDITLTLTEAKRQPQPPQPKKRGNDGFTFLENDLIQALGVDQQGALSRFKRQNNPKNSALVLNLQTCVRYLGERPTDMVIVDIGVFTGFELDERDLENLVNSQDHLVDEYQKTSRAVVIYLQETPTENYCFDFRIKRKFIVGNTQMSVVRVYDYYNPDVSSTQFYSLDQSSPMLRQICSNGICQCAEGLCPLKNPFRSIIQLKDGPGDSIAKLQAARKKLREKVCDKNDYAWKGKVTDMRKSGDFLRIQFLVEVVLKEGIEDGADLIGEVRELLVRDNCKTDELILNQKYLIMGQDAEKYIDVDQNSQYRYLLDRSTTIHTWSPNKSDRTRFLQGALNYVEMRLLREGCHN